jgi:isoleucyl-tRNA synthetase
VNSQVINKVADVMEKSGLGLEAFHSKPASEFTAGHKCEKCKHDTFTAGKDILDVWFDSGVCHSGMQARRKDMRFEADIYLEGSDQHRG